MNNMTFQQDGDYMVAYINGKEVARVKIAKAGGGVTPEELDEKLADYQLKLTAGDNITIEQVEGELVISATGGELPIASSETLGGVKVGSGLSIDGEGVLSTSGGSTPHLYRHRIQLNITIPQYGYDVILSPSRITIDIYDTTSTAYTQLKIPNGYCSFMEMYQSSDKTIFRQSEFYIDTTQSYVNHPWYKLTETGTVMQMVLTAFSIFSDTVTQIF